MSVLSGRPDIAALALSSAVFMISNQYVFTCSIFILYFSSFTSNVRDSDNFLLIEFGSIFCEYEQSQTFKIVCKNNNVRYRRHIQHGNNKKIINNRNKKAMAKHVWRDGRQVNLNIKLIIIILSQKYAWTNMNNMMMMLIWPSVFRGKFYIYKKAKKKHWLRS